MRTTLKALLRLALAWLRRVPSGRRAKQRDYSVGKRGGRDPLTSMSWQDLRDEIYGGR